MSQVENAVTRALKKSGRVDTISPVGDSIHGLVEALIVMGHEMDRLREEFTEFKKQVDAIKDPVVG